MISSLVLLAICAPLVHSSTPKPHLEVNNLQGLLPSSDPLENVRALLAEQIAGLSALLTQMTGVKCSSHSSESAQETLVRSLSIYLHAHGNLFRHMKSQSLSLLYPMSRSHSTGTWTKSESSSRSTRARRKWPGQASHPSPCNSHQSHLNGILYSMRMIASAVARLNPHRPLVAAG